jgi:alpha-D-xyloside xylohydrolase
MPYLFGAALEATTHGTPMLRAMLLEFPEDPGCDMLDRQYMLGSDLLVAPVFTADGTVDFYLPAGKWTHFFSGQVLNGGRWLRETHDFMSLPLLVRPNTILPVGANDQRPDYDFAAGVTFHLFELAEGASLACTVPDLKGNPALTLSVELLNGLLTLQAAGHSTAWKALLRGIHTCQSIEGAAVTDTPQGLLLTPSGSTVQLRLD